MDDVARLARVGVGTVYRHFPTKDRSSSARRRADGLAGRPRRGAPVGPGTPWERLSGLLWNSARRFADDASAAELMAARPDKGRQAGAEVERLHAATGTILAEAVAAGQLRPDATIEDIPPIMCGLGQIMAIFGPAGAVGAVPDDRARRPALRGDRPLSTRRSLWEHRPDAAGRPR